MNWHSIKHFNGERTNQILVDSLRIPAGDENRPSEADTREFHAIWEIFQQFLEKEGKILILPTLVQSRGKHRWVSNFGPAQHHQTFRSLILEERRKNVGGKKLPHAYETTIIRMDKYSLLSGSQYR